MAGQSDEIFRLIRREDANQGQIFNNIKGTKKAKKDMPPVKPQGEIHVDLNQGKPVKKQQKPLLSEILDFDKFEPELQETQRNELSSKRIDPKNLVSNEGVFEISLSKENSEN